MLDLAAELPVDALEMVQDFGRDAYIVRMCRTNGSDPDKPWRDSELVPGDPVLIRAAFATQGQAMLLGERTKRRTATVYVAALDPGLGGEPITTTDLILIPGTAGDPGTCVTWSIEDLDDLQLDPPIVFVLNLVRQ